MLEQIVLGLVQGVAEWLPISSEGAIIAIKNNFFPEGESLSELVRLALFLHLGTFLSALIYFRKEVSQLLSDLLSLRGQEGWQEKKVLAFLTTSFLVSGLLGFGLLSVVKNFEETLQAGSKIINLLIALALFFTAYLQFRSLESREDNLRSDKDLGWRDGLALGVAQGLAVIPGLSRSGLTVSILLLRKFGDETALRLSFLMSLPIVLVGNIVLNANLFSSLTLAHLLALLASFVSGLLTIDLLLRLAKRINFAYFTLVFALLMIVSVFV